MADDKYHCYQYYRGEHSFFNSFRCKVVNFGFYHRHRIQFFQKNYFYTLLYLIKIYFKKNYIFYAFIKDLVHVMYTYVHIIIVRFIHLGLGFNLDWSL